jgi:hypothetical protein
LNRRTSSPGPRRRHRPAGIGAHRWCPTAWFTAPYRSAPEVCTASPPIADQVFIKLLIATRADALVTGDRDLLALAGATDRPIVTPAELRDAIG